MSVAHYFNVDKIRSKKIILEVGQAVATWRLEAKNFSIKKSEVDRMATAFDHEDLTNSLK